MRFPAQGRDYFDQSDLRDLYVVVLSRVTHIDDPGMPWLADISLDNSGTVKKIQRHQRGPRSSLTISEADLPPLNNCARRSRFANSSAIRGTPVGILRSLPSRYCCWVNWLTDWGWDANGGVLKLRDSRSRARDSTGLPLCVARSKRLAYSSSVSTIVI